MIRRINGRHVWLTAFACAAALTIALPASAQSTGMVKGTVKDDKGEAVEGAKIIIEFAEGMNRRQETKTNKKGEFVQIGLQPGGYKVTAEKEGVGAKMMETRVRLGATAELNFVLAKGTAGPTKEDMAKNAALKKAFEEGVDLSKPHKLMVPRADGTQEFVEKPPDYDAAAVKFNEAVQLSPTCADCYYNLAYVYSQKKDYEKAEAAYKKAIEIKADYADAYNGLANVYNSQRKFEQAAAASAKANELSSASAGTTGTTGGNANALYNQGVILWNAGKLADAKKQFEAALKVDPNHAESHYQLGMALLSEDIPKAVTEFETYLKIAPEGPNAATAKAVVTQYKK